MQKGFPLILIALVVILGGYFLYQQQTKSTPTSQPSSTSDKTANPDSIGATWKTYTSKYGFSFKYPPNFMIDESDNQDKGAEIDTLLVTNFSIKELYSVPVKKNPDDEDVFEMSIYYDRRINTDLQTEKTNNYKDTNAVHYTFSDYPINNEPGLKIVEDATFPDGKKLSGFSVLTVHNHKMFSFHLRHQTPKHSQAFDKILSTFKFTN